MISFDKSWGPVIAKKVGCGFNWDDDQVICRVDDDDEKLYGGSIFYHNTGESISMHCAAFRPNWLNRELLWQTFSYPFCKLQCNRIFCMIAVTNDESIKFTYALGFRSVNRVKKLYRGGVDCLVVCLERENCRYLGTPKNLKSEQFLHYREAQEA